METTQLKHNISLVGAACIGAALSLAYPHLNIIWVGIIAGFTALVIGGLLSLTGSDTLSFRTGGDR